MLRLDVKPMTHSPDFGAETRRRSAPKIGAVSGTKNRRRKSTERIRNRQAPVGSDRRQIGMTHSPENRRRLSAPIGAEFRRRNLDCVSSALIMPVPSVLWDLLLLLCKNVFY